MAAVATVEQYMDGLDAPARAIVDGLRPLILACHPDLDESIKWNAPNYAHRGEDRITLNLHRGDSIRIILHRGAAVKDVAGFSFEDPDKLARWPAPDRGVVLIEDAAAVEARRDRLADLFRRWIEATA